jgi:hypothetical protein
MLGKPRTLRKRERGEQFQVSAFYLFTVLVGLGFELRASLCFQSRWSMA